MLDDPLPPTHESIDTPLFDETAPLYVPSLAPAHSPQVSPSPSSSPWTPTGLAPIEALVVGDRPTTTATAPRWPMHALAPASLWTSPSPVRRAHLGSPPVPLRERHAFRQTVAVVVCVLLVTSTALAIYLFTSARGWRDRSESYLLTSLDLGNELASTRSDLAGAQAELEAVRTQLDTAHQRIGELADEKAQIGDEWEITQQLVDYQRRVSQAAGEVALALDQCVQGQQEFIGYLQAAAEPDGPVYDPNELTAFETDVEALCQAASEANIALQLELSR